jgi:transcription elongation GreA/GreB family factor
MSTDLRSAELLQPARDGEAEIGERVTVIDLSTSAVHDYRLVGTDADRVCEGEVSISTALGSVLLGSRVGDVFSVDESGRLSRLEVVEIGEASDR